MNEEKLQVFVDGVQKYFAQIADEDMVIGVPYLVSNERPAAKDYTGVIAISGKYKGIVYFTAPRDLLERMLILLGEPQASEEYLADLVGEVANTISGNARSELGDQFEISVPIVLRGAPDEILLPRRDRSFVIPLSWRNRSAAIVVALLK